MKASGRSSAIERMGRAVVSLRAQEPSGMRSFIGQELKMLAPPARSGVMEGRERCPPIFDFATNGRPGDGARTETGSDPERSNVRDAIKRITKDRAQGAV